jgi:hypothetical protein
MSESFIRYQPTNSDRMFCYLWYETTNPDECKFGERWVFAGQDPVAEVTKRVKKSLDVRKDLLKDGIVRIAAIWDVTDVAKSSDRYYKQSRVDDYIRSHIGYRKNTTGEIHTLSPERMEIAVNQWLSSQGQPLPTVGLAPWQHEDAAELVTAIDNGSRVILAEQCARYGKTIWSGAVSVITEIPLTIVAAYVTTSFSSFKKDLTRFQQFKDLVIVDSMDDDYQAQVSAGLKSGRQVVVFLSMCQGSNRQKRIDYLFGLRKRRLVFIDEADYGAHRENQSKPFIDAKKRDDVVVLMTGTNGDRAGGEWDIDYYMGTTYADLLVYRAETSMVA